MDPCRSLQGWRGLPWLATVRVDGLAWLLREGARRSEGAFGHSLFGEDQLVGAGYEEAVTLDPVLDDQLTATAEQFFARYRLRLGWSPHVPLGIWW
jgi:hypothetical protein